jgi:hypothetical protein
LELELYVVFGQRLATEDFGSTVPLPQNVAFAPVVKNESCTLGAVEPAIERRSKVTVSAKSVQPHEGALK